MSASSMLKDWIDVLLYVLFMFSRNQQTTIRGREVYLGKLSVGKFKLGKFNGGNDESDDPVLN